jgi:hypothetical protein
MSGFKGFGTVVLYFDAAHATIVSVALIRRMKVWLFGSSDHLTSVAQSACFCDIWGIWAIKLFIEVCQSSLSPFLYTGYNTPLVQLLGSVSLVQACWITACNASTRLGPPFFNRSAAIESAPAALLFFRYFSASSISSRLGKSMSTLSSFKSTGRVGWLVLERNNKNAVK